MSIQPVKPTIIVDTREQTPYSFERFRSDFATVDRGALMSGDYSLKGFETNIQIERKSLQDLVNTIIHNRQRFVMELIRLHQAEFSCVIIEASHREIASPYSFSKARPNSVVGSIQSFMVHYQVPFYAAGDRTAAEEMTVGFLLKAWKAYSKHTA